MSSIEKELLRCKQATLTTQHLIIKKNSIKLSDILEAYPAVDWVGYPKVDVRLRDGSTKDFLVPDSRSSGSQIFGVIDFF